MIKKFKIFIWILLTLMLLPSCAFARIKACPYRIVEDPNGVYIVEITTDKARNKIIPYLSETLETNREVYDKTGARLVVNAGFFDAKNQKTVSYVTINGTIVADPKENENLMQNEALQPYMDKILNRSEFRILKNNKGKIIYDIAQHNDPIQEGFNLIHSIQAGPMLFPELKLEDEFFILKKDDKVISESASSLHKYPRTAIGIRENNIYLFIITKENPMTLEEVSNLARRWGMEKAMGFDGGGSTSFDSQELHITSEKDNQARKVKSFLIITKNSQLK